jgi:hypothetical protein
MWIIKRQAGAVTYFTGRDRTPWSSELRDAHCYVLRDEAEDAVGNMDWPTGSIEFEELPYASRNN